MVLIRIRLHYSFANTDNVEVFAWHAVHHTGVLRVQVGHWDLLLLGDLGLGLKLLCLEIAYHVVLLFPSFH